MIGPFIYADIMGPEHFDPGVGADIDAHPHIGLSTLTYLTAGSLVHRDSTGAVQQIEPGEVNWMTAGSGVCHTERSTPDDRLIDSDLAGLQTWVALPKDAESSGAFFEHAGGNDIPTDFQRGATIRVLAGTGWGMDSPIKGSSRLLEADLTLVEGVLKIPAEHRERGVINLSGELAVAGQALAEGQLAVLTTGEEVELTGTGRAMLLAGDPVGERFIWWNFVASDRELIEAAKHSWDQQTFPKVPHDHERWMSRPQS